MCVVLEIGHWSKTEALTRSYLALKSMPLVWLNSSMLAQATVWTACSKIPTHHHQFSLCRGLCQGYPTPATRHISAHPAMLTMASLRFIRAAKSTQDTRLPSLKIHSYPSSEFRPGRKAGLWAKSRDAQGDRVGWLKKIKLRNLLIEALHVFPCLRILMCQILPGSSCSCKRW